MNSWLEIAADRTGFRNHRDRLQPHAREGAQVGDEHLVVGMPRAGLVEVEGIGVLHQEFAAAHQAEARAHLVAELPLDVIEVERKIAIGAHIGAEDVGDHLLVGRTIQHFTSMTVLDSQHFLAVSVVASALAPQLRALYRRHQKFDRAGSVLLLAHDVADLVRARAGRAAGTRRCLRPPAASCRRAASAGARRSPPLSGSRAGSEGSTATVASFCFRGIGRIGAHRSETGSRPKIQGALKALGRLAIGDSRLLPCDRKML